MPQVQGPLGGLLQDVSRNGGMPKDNPFRRLLIAVSEVIRLREEEYVRKLNRYAVFHGVLIVVLAVVLALLLVVGARQLREAPKKHLILDVSLTVGLLMLFQVYFFFFGKTWYYSSADEHCVNISRVYDPDGGALQHLRQQAPEFLEPAGDPPQTLVQQRTRDALHRLLVEEARKTDLQAMTWETLSNYRHDVL